MKNTCVLLSYVDVSSWIDFSQKLTRCASQPRNMIPQDSDGLGRDFLWAIHTHLYLVCLSYEPSRSHVVIRNILHSSSQKVELLEEAISAIGQYAKSMVLEDLDENTLHASASVSSVPMTGRRMVQRSTCWTRALSGGIGPSQLLVYHVC